MCELEFSDVLFNQSLSRHMRGLIQKLKKIFLSFFLYNFIKFKQFSRLKIKKINRYHEFILLLVE
jgi:hypothetical protein